MSPDARLKAHLRTIAAAHGTNTRPVLDPSSNVTVQFGMRLIQVDIIEARNVMAIGVWVRMKWVDEILRWNASEFNGLRRATLHPDWLWTPKIELVNTADTDQNARMADVAVTSAGTVFWITHHKYESACLVDLKFYPFDEQACDLWFQSLSETSNDLVLDIYPPGFDLETQLSGFREADEWEVIQNTSEVIRRPRDEGELLVFSRRRSLRLRLVLRRRVGFNAYLQSVPCVVLSSMTIMVFVLPQERPDRHIIGEKTSQNWNRIDPMLHGSIGSILFQS